MKLERRARSHPPPTPEEKIMAEQQLMLTAEERKFLAELLSRVLKDVQVEEHRTRSLSFREIVVREEKMIKALLSKLGQPSG
jgi:hypothetical protein